MRKQQYNAQGLNLNNFQDTPIWLVICLFVGISIIVIMLVI